jgi:2-furoyl-CoA dehydrogenase FAD binding subunit
VKPAPFDYLRAESLAEVHAVLAAQGGDATIIAGGQTLVPLLSMRMARPQLVVDIMHLSELATITREDGNIRVGAGVRQAELLAWPDLARHQPLLASALPWVGHAQTRARGTVCGSIALADPSAELPLVMVALGGEIELSAANARRRVPARDFFMGLMSTDRGDDELIEAVRFPCRRAGEGTAFIEFARRHGDFAIVACAAVASSDNVRLAVGGVGDQASAREFGTLDGEDLDDALVAFADALDARDDLHATADYRRGLVQRLGHQAIMEARQCRA